ncbi:unnamed protein product [Arabidopsis halleri]
MQSFCFLLYLLYVTFSFSKIDVWIFVWANLFSILGHIVTELISIFNLYLR